MHIITMLLLLSVLILVHELGHFFAARKIGVKVEKFGFGLPFGPTLYEKDWGGTKVCVHSFLLGGYVSFPDDEEDSETPKDSPERIANRKVWERAIIVSAGVTANAIIAYFIVLFVAVFSGGLPSGNYNVFINGLLPEKTYSAHDIGIQPNDKILSANDTKINTLNKFIEIAHRSRQFDNYAEEKVVEQQISALKKLNPAINEVNTAIEKGKTILLPDFIAESKLSLGNDALAGAVKYTPSGISLSKDEQTLRNTFEGKKNYVSDGKYSLKQLAVALSDTAHPIEITVLRDNKAVVLKPAFPNKDGMIGIKLSVQELTEKINSPAAAVTKSWNYLYKNSYYMVKGLGLMITGQIPLNQIHGIVAITKVGSDIIERSGIWDGLLLTALISIDLAIVNLLPIPALDGGHLLFLLIEQLRGKPVEEKVQEAFAKYGFAFLLALMAVIIFNDIFALITDKL